MQTITTGRQTQKSLGRQTDSLTERKAVCKQTRMQTGTQVSKHVDGQRDRQADRQAEKQTDRHIV